MYSHLQEPEEKWMEDLEKTAGKDARRAAERIAEFLLVSGLAVKAIENPSSLKVPFNTPDGEPINIGFIRNDHLSFEFPVGNLGRTKAYSSDIKRLELLNLLKSELSPDVEIENDSENRWPNIPFDKILDNKIWIRFSCILLTVIKNISAETSN
ncbi:hypothetical protein [Breoghania corrubedonensis]|uniref:hypothetical protein n=1 Tax=Breoghania corrubedonensis TaxID=665038 RepID=UPI0011B2509F|nr:hypothetical protein [Breoghania corrubedonensis]